MKRTAKAKSLALVERLAGVPLPRDAMLDVQVKRIHEVGRGEVWLCGCGCGSAVDGLCAAGCFFAGGGVDGRERAALPCEVAAAPDALPSLA